MKLNRCALFVACVLVAASTEAGVLRDHIRQRRAATDDTAVQHIAYGSDALQTFDVYLPAERQTDAPVIVMVHGGGWKRGDKTMRRSLDAKRERWVPRGFIFVSTNYRLLPETEVKDQLADIALAIATAQEKAASWGGDRRRFILMGHSAGAHLVSLYAASPRFAAAGANAVLGTIALDSAALDVTRIMAQPHFDLYNRPFGDDPAYWKAMSPIHQLATGAPPALLVCSSRRTDSCSQAEAFAERTRSLGNHADVLREDLSHGAINSELGLDNDYTRAVERFMAGLDPAVARRLQ